jgi:DNA-binding IclR family transcriptional regulator
MTPRSNAHSESTPSARRAGREHKSVGESGKTDSPPAGQVQVLEKAVGLLDALAHQGELTPSALAEISGEPRTTVHRLLASLRSLGMVDPGTARGSFRVGLKVLDLGNSMLSRLDERLVARDTLQRLHDETQETVYLCVRRDDRAVCIERLDGLWVRSMALQLGSSLPLHIGATPMVLLAFAPHEDWNQYVAIHELVGISTPAVRDPIEFLAELQVTRDRGYAISDGDTVPGLAGIAAPIFDYSGTLRASLGLSGLSVGILGERTERCVQAVTEAATEISLAFGHRA